MMECLKVQQNHPWRQHVKQLEEKYQVKIEECEGKSREEWKRSINQKIRKVVVNTAIKEMESHTKLRFCNPRTWKRQKYLTEQKHHDATKILQLKLNMNELKSNYKNKYLNDQLCEMCKEDKETN